MASEFDKVAADYDTLLNSATSMTGFEAGEFAEAKVKRLATLFPQVAREGGCFLDYGCGAGNLLASFRDYFPETSYTGVDPSAEMIARAREKYQDTGRFVETASAEWQQEKYDLVFIANVLHHIPHDQHQSILASLCALLNPGGHLAIWEHNPLNPVTRRIVRDCEFDRDAVLVPPRQMKHLLRRLLLQNATLHYTTFFPKWLGFLGVLEPSLGWCPLGGQYLIIGEMRIAD